MRLTEEQKTIISSSGNIKIHAVAGSGKTSTLIEYAKKHGKNLRVLYLAFNRSVKLEAQQRFTSAGLSNIKIETAHSLAWKKTVPQNGYQVRASYKPHEISQILQIKPSAKDPLTTIAICDHIGKLTSLFCNQAVSKVNDIDYCSYIHESRAKDFVSKHYEKIVSGSRRLLAMMNSSEIDVTHEFYLKKYQLLKPQLDFDMILFDEGQDASPVMLDIFLNQKDALKIIVGDVHQQIYSWRYAINALAHIDFKDCSLSASFRFPQNIADLAMNVLRWKKHINYPSEIKITGKGKIPVKLSSKAILARTNLSLLRSAIEYCCGNNKKNKIYFEGNLNSYMYANEGASLWDILSLYQGKFNNIRDPLIKQMKSIDDLQEYADISNDTELLSMIEMVNEHGSELPFHINRIKELHVNDKDRDKAAMIFSTVHRCKGLEYDSVTLENDFISENKVLRLSEKKNPSKQELEMLNEEINLLYVAITRSRGVLNIPDSIFSENINVYSSSNSLSKTPVISKINRQHDSDALAYSHWTSNDDHRLRFLYSKGNTVKQIALQLNRTTGAVSSRIRKLGLKTIQKTY